MRQLTAAEILSLTKALEMETNSLNVIKAGRMALADEQLKLQVEAGIDAAEARITGLHQFIQENNILSATEGQAYRQQPEVM